MTNSALAVDMLWGSTPTTSRCFGVCAVRAYDCESEAVLWVCGCVLQAWTLVRHYLSEPVTVESEAVL